MAWPTLPPFRVEATAAQPQIHGSLAKDAPQLLQIRTSKYFSYLCFWLIAWDITCGEGS